MTERTPDPADNKPSQAEGGPEDQDVESAVDPAGNKPSQAEGDPGNMDTSPDQEKLPEAGEDEPAS